jgi:6-phosphogluconolactonase
MRKTPTILTVCVLVFCAAGRTACADSFVFVSLLQQRKIVTFHRDIETGKLDRRAETDCPAEPAFLAASEDGRTLFASLRSSGQLAAFRIDPSHGQLSLINVVEGGEDPAFLIPDRSGKFLLTAYYVSDKVTVHSIASDGRLSDSPVHAVATADNAHGIAIDSENQSVYVSHTGANRVDQFRFASGQGRLTPLEPPFVLAKPGQNPRHIVLHPSNRWAYCSNEAGSSDADGASMYTRDLNMRLTLQQSVSSLPDDFDAGQNSTSRCLMTRDGKYLYVANRGHHSIAGFSIDQQSGQLARVSVTPTEAIPRSFTITRDGRHLYAAGEGSGHVAAVSVRRSASCRGV